jgi:hypothetical protein
LREKSKKIVLGGCMAQLFDKFNFDTIPLQKIALDPDNPRIVTQSPLKTQAEIIAYLFNHEKLAEFISHVVKQGKNKGAERPYVIKSDDGYTVMEGNTRIAAYKILCGLEHAPPEYEDDVPTISEEFKGKLLVVDCAIAPNRDAMMSIMAHSHFGVGDKLKWGYLGSRRAVYNEWKKGKSISQLAKIFEQSQSDIIEYLLEYTLYMEALKLPLNQAQKDVLLNPQVQFNPPVRFLQTSGHKEKLGIEYDRQAIAIKFLDTEAKAKFQHLILKVVLGSKKGTDSYDVVFSDYTSPQAGGGHGATAPGTSVAASAGGMSTSGVPASSGSNVSSSSATHSGNSPQSPGGQGLKSGALFKYNVKRSNQLLVQLLKEAREINANKLPAAGTFLLRNITEALLKDIIHEKKLNQNNDELSLGLCLDRCIGHAAKAGLSTSDVKVLKEFKKDHLTYLNLGAHGNVIPSYNRLIDARNTIDQFIKVHI